MKPCDCHDQYTVNKELKEQGLTVGVGTIEVEPGSVILTLGSCKLRIAQGTFKRFAEWYLEDQNWKA